MAADLLNAHVKILLDDNDRSAAAIAALPASSWHQMGPNIANFQYADSALWLLIDLPPSLRSDDSLFELRWPFFDSVQWFSVDSGGVHGPLLELGDHHGMVDRNLFSRFPVWNVPAHGEGVKWLLRLQGSGLLLVPLYQWDVQAYVRQEQQAQLVLGLLFGTLLLMILYNLGVWLQTRDSSFLFYVCYVAAVMLYQASLYGIGFQYVWHDSPYLADKMLALSVGGSFLFGTLFFTYYLQLPRRRPMWHRAVLLVALNYAVGTFLAFFLPESKQVVVAQVVGGLVSLSAMALAISEWRAGNPLARYFTIAWIFLLLGTCIYTGALAGLLPYNRFTEIVQTVGVVVELVLLSLALGARIQQERLARREAMELSLSLAQQVNLANQETIRVQDKAKFELEEKVLQRTQELEAALQRLEHANTSLARLSVTDALTGLKNRRYFSEQIVAEFQRALRDQIPVSLLMVDLDHFKQINDTYGHPVGDECIRMVADILAGQCRRPGDMAVRYGGEEMLLLLVNTDSDGAMNIAENVRSRIEKATVSFDQQLIRITTSVGVATVIPDVKDSPEQLLTAADQALYQAKREGRNRVCRADGLCGHQGVAQ